MLLCIFSRQGCLQVPVLVKVKVEHGSVRAYVCVIERKKRVPTVMPRPFCLLRRWPPHALHTDHTRMEVSAAPSLANFTLR